MTRYQKKKIVDLYAQYRSCYKVAEILGHNKAIVLKILHEKGIELKHNSQPGFIPTEEQIQEATAKFQEGWSEGERLRRLGKDESHWTPPLVSIPGINHRGVKVESH